MRQRALAPSKNHSVDPSTHRYTHRKHLTISEPNLVIVKTDLNRGHVLARELPVKWNKKGPKKRSISRDHIGDTGNGS